MRGIKHCIQNQKGYTLVELLVVLAIVGIVVGAMGKFMVSQLQIFERESDRIDLIYEASIAVEACSSAIMPASSVTALETDLVTGNLITMTLQNSGSANTTTLRVDQGEKTLLMRRTGEAEFTLARDIESVRVERIRPDGGSTVGLRMIFNLAKDNVVLTKEVRACFRN